MRSTCLIVALIAGLSARTAYAEVPRVVTDIPPVHSLVSAVMQEVGEPALLVRTAVSVHSNALRPSEAGALEAADLVFWMGPELTPWLEKPISVLPANAEIVELLDAEGIVRLEFRETEVFDTHGGHDDHDDHDDHDKHGHDEHDHTGVDPHAWLDPDNARVWLSLIAERLAASDPENAALYRLNSEAAQSEIDSMTAELETELEPLRGSGFIVFHDAYQYFETRFGLTVSGAIADGDAADPGPARVAALRDYIRAEGTRCLLSEPQMRSGLAETVLEGTEARIATVDPIGSTLDPGPDLYTGLLRGFAASLRECLS